MRNLKNEIRKVRLNKYSSSPGKPVKLPEINASGLQINRAPEKVTAYGNEYEPILHKSPAKISVRKNNLTPQKSSANGSPSLKSHSPYSQKMVNVDKKASRLFSDPDELSGVNDNFGKVPRYIKDFRLQQRDLDRKKFQ